MKKEIYDILMEEGMNTVQAMRIRDKIIRIFDVDIIPDRKQSESHYNITCMNCREEGKKADFTSKCNICGMMACFTVLTLSDASCMHCERREQQ